MLFLSSCSFRILWVFTGHVTNWEIGFTVSGTNTFSSSTTLALSLPPVNQLNVLITFSQGYECSVANYGRPSVSPASPADVRCVCSCVSVSLVTSCRITDDWFGGVLFVGHHFCHLLLFSLEFPANSLQLFVDLLFGVCVRSCVCARERLTWLLIVYSENVSGFKMLFHLCLLE